MNEEEENNLVMSLPRQLHSLSREMKVKLVQNGFVSADNFPSCAEATEDWDQLFVLCGFNNIQGNEVKSLIVPHVDNSNLDASSSVEANVNEELPMLIDVCLETNYTKPENTFMGMMEMLTFGHQPIAERVEEVSLDRNCNAFDFSFDWNSKLESDSYAAVVNFLSMKGIHAVQTDQGQGLPDNLLYYEELWTLINSSSDELRETEEHSTCKYILYGRTDIVVLGDPSMNLGKFSNRYFIEIKRVQDLVGDVEKCLREAVLQLIGGNASNTFHSPPVLLTDLVGKHYVLYITRIGSWTLEHKYKLNVLKMKTFGEALFWVEERTKSTHSVTMHLARRPAPSRINTRQTIQYSSVQLEW